MGDRMSEKKQEEYGVGKLHKSKPIPAPDLPYRPLRTKSYQPNIAVIGCGGISEHHLTAYKNAGYKIVALCDVVKERADERRQAFYPHADVYSDYRHVLDREDIEVVDITTHPPERGPIIEAAIHAGKHILSQKPFVTDISYGLKLAQLAKEKKIKLAVNQNGRWAPHFSYARHAIAAGLLGEITAAHMNVHWDHNWIADKAFNDVHHIILYDFAIHWFDILGCFIHKKPKRVYASLTSSPNQKAKPPLLGQALIEYDGAQASLSFDADTRYGHQDRTFITGTKGSIISVGLDLMEQHLTLYTHEGHTTPELQGKWFPDGLHGAMAELLCAIEDDRVPYNNAEGNLKGLSLCFAAVQSAEIHQPIAVGTITNLSGKIT